MRNNINNLRTPICLLQREELLKVNSELIEQLQGRLRAKRFRLQEGDSLKLAYIRVLIQALQVQNVILKDKEICDLKTEIEELKALVTCQSRA